MLENHLKIVENFGDTATLADVLIYTELIGIGRRLGYSQNNFEHCQQQLIKEIYSHAE